MAAHFDEVWDDEGCNQMCDTCRHAVGVSYMCNGFHGHICQQTFLFFNKCENPLLLTLAMSRLQNSRYYPVCQAGGAHLGVSSIHGREADSSEAGGGVDGERPS